MSARTAGAAQPPHDATVRFVLAASIRTGDGPYMLAVRYWSGTGFWGPFEWAQGYTTRTLAGVALDHARVRVTDKDNARLIRVWASDGCLIRATYGQDWEDLGARLRRVRRVANITHDRAAQAVQVPRTAMSDIEAGRRKIYAHEYAKLCRLYDVDPDEMLAGLPGEVQRRTR